jgi:alpha,alpha-trehalase
VAGVLLLPYAAYVQTAPQPQRQPILVYIEQTWAVLTRSHRALAKAAADPKFSPGPDGRWPVYLPHTEDLARVRRQLQLEMANAEFQKLDLRLLPQDLAALREPGLLYLPRPCVVPGGRFNEMYGWDSYFIWQNRSSSRHDGQLPL